MKTVLLVVVLLCAASAVTFKNKLDYSNKRSMTAVLAEVEAKIKTKAPLDAILNVLRDFRDAVNTEQVNHDEIYQTQVSEIKLDSKVKEGWGLSHRIKDGELQVFITDGSSQIHIADENFIVKQSIQVKYKGEYVTWLNELEYADGILYANQYTKPYIYAIDVDTGNVIARYDFSFLVMEANRPDGCLNGIAYNKKNNSFWITGKNWPFFQEVKLL